MKETDEYFFFYKHVFGQWTKKTITDRIGIEYNCCEQYMMFHKAILFGDENIAKQILENDNPSEQQKLGRQVSNFSNEKWICHRFMIVWEGNFLKFTQHNDLKSKLISTSGKQLVEASPIDKIWGCGLSADDDRIIDPNNWTGKNLLGEVITSVRNAIIITG